jgi:hypothetical protein
VYVASAAQLSGWLADWGRPQAPVRSLTIQEVAPSVEVEGPVDELVPAVNELHRRLAQRAWNA